MIRNRTFYLNRRDADIVNREEYLEKYDGCKPPFIICSVDGAYVDVNNVPKLARNSHDRNILNKWAHDVVAVDATCPCICTLRWAE